MAIARHTSHDGKYDPRMLNSGEPEHPAVTTSKSRLIAKLIQL
jgi:hypothetical protein